MCIPKFNNVSNFVSKVSRNHIFFAILRSKTKLMMNVRFRICLWEIQMQFGYNFQNSLLRCKKNEWPFGCSFQNFVFRCKKNKWPSGYNSKFRISL